jgi:hypothetical protein
MVCFPDRVSVSTASKQNKTVAKPTAPFIQSGDKSKNALTAARADFCLTGSTTCGLTKPASALSFQTPIDSRTAPNELHLVLAMPATLEVSFKLGCLLVVCFAVEKRNQFAFTFTS